MPLARYQSGINALTRVDQFLTGSVFLVEHAALFGFCLAYSGCHVPRAQDKADFGTRFEPPTAGMKENREIATIQFFDEIAEPLRSANVKGSNSSNPFVATTPTGISRTFCNKENDWPIVNLRKRPVLLSWRKQTARQGLCENQKICA